MAKMEYELNCAKCGQAVTVKHPNLNYIKPNIACAKCGATFCLRCAGEGTKCPACGYVGIEKAEEPQIQKESYIQRKSAKHKAQIMAAFRAESPLELLKALLPVYEDCLIDLDERVSKLENNR